MNTSQSTQGLIPDIVAPSHLAHLLDNQGEIVERHEAASTLHTSAQAMAAELVDYLEIVGEKMTAGELNGAAHVLRLKHYAEQLQAFHLMQLNLA